jgi:hypothetical protein
MLHSTQLQQLGLRLKVSYFLPSLPTVVRSTNLNSIHIYLLQFYNAIIPLKNGTFYAYTLCIFVM